MPFNYEIKDSSTLASIIKGNGYRPEDDPSDKSQSRLTIADAIQSNELGPLIPNAVVELIREPIEPLQVLTSLLPVVPWQNGPTEVKMPAIGTLSVEEIAEGQAYPERRLNLGGAMQTVTTGKYGVALSFTEETIKYSRWDIVSLHARHAGLAFVRRRETNVAKHILGLGQTMFDNRVPTASLRGPTTGRDMTMAANGTITADDIYDMYAELLFKGYQPDLMIMNPMTWIQFVRDPVLRAFAFAAGGGVLYAPYEGSALNAFPKVTPLGVAGGNPSAGLGTPNTGAAPDYMKDFNLAMSSAPKLPSYLPFSLRIVVSPFVPFDPASKLSDMILCDSRTLGNRVVEEDISSDEWKDPKTDISYMKFKERYGLFSLEEGQGTLVARNVKIAQNWWTGEPARGSYDPTALSAITSTTVTV